MIRVAARDEREARAMDARHLASHLEHTLLRPEARRADIEAACQLGRELGE